MVTVISEFTKQDLLRYIKINPSKVRVVYDCISADFKFDPKTFNGVKPVILQVGTKENKNIIRVVQALKGIPCHYRVIGKLNEKQTTILEQCKIEYSSVFNIPDTQIVEEYRRCDMLVFASTFEGFGMPIIEAQATGRPVITSNVCSMPEVAGGAACLVNPYDVQDIKRGLIKVMTDHNYRNTLISRGYRNSRNFKPEYIASQYGQIYKEIYSLI
jgi:glycosyltransferase involved in cell wall biosynthesis